MKLRPYWQFYKDIYLFVLVFSITSWIALGPLWGILFYFTVGLLFGFFAFHFIKNNEYYSYQNLGITKFKLYRVAFVINLIVGILMFTLAFILISILRGEFSFT